MTSGPRTLVMVLAAACVTACGSTVQNTAAGPAQAGVLSAPGSAASLDGLQPGEQTAVGGPGPVAPGSQPFGGTTGTAGSVTGTSGTTAGAGGAGAPGEPGPAVAAGQGAPGITDMTIAFGAIYAANRSNTGYAPGVTPGDARTYWDIMVKEVNRRGGVLGRSLTPVYYPFDASSSSTLAEQYQAACARWTQDNKVFAAFAAPEPGLLRCIARAGGVVVNEGAPPSADISADAQTFRDFPFHIELAGLNLDRMARVWMAGLLEQGYFGTAPKIGLLSYETVEFDRALKRTLLPTLAAAGLPQPELVQVAAPKRTSDTATLSAAVGNAVLRFQTRGVTHVMFFENTGDLALLFFPQAESQRFRPLYGLHSLNGAQLIAQNGLAPPAQLEKSVGVGWLPAMDLSSEDNTDDGPYSNSAKRACLKVMREQGQRFDSSNAKGVALIVCDQIWFLKAALEKGMAGVPGPVTRDRFMSGVASLGSSFVNARTFVTSFSATKHDGVAATRPFAYQSECGCYRYTGPNRPLPPGATS